MSLYYVMPLVSGETLRERIAREGALPLEDVRRIVTDVSAALDYAHRNGVVHRDVKPANILVDAEHATVADFGIAHRALDESADQITPTGIVIGTPHYMSPEQSTGSRNIDARTDIYAFGCVLFEMLTGVPPYQGATVPNVIAKHLQAPIPSAQALRPELSPSMDEVLARALGKEPAARFSSARELSAAVAAAVDSSGGTRVATRSGGLDRTTIPRRWSRARIATGAAIGVIALGGIAIAGLTHFQRALEIDSLYARARGARRHVQHPGVDRLRGADGSVPARRESGTAALQLDSTLAEAHISLAIIHVFGDWDWAAANRATARAIALDSTLAAAWYWRTWHLIAAGRPSEATITLQRARALDPLSLITNARIATVLAWERRLRAADSVLRQTLEIDPTYPVARVQRARVLSLLGRHDEAIAVLPPDSVRLGSFESGIAGFVYARAGRRNDALAVARALESRSYVPAEGVAAIYAGLGDRDAALTWLERAVSSRGVGRCSSPRSPCMNRSTTTRVIAAWSLKSVSSVEHCD